MNREMEIEEIEVELLVDAIRKRYGHDFTDYAPASLYRRIRQVAQKENLSTISEMIPLLLHDTAFAARLVNGLSVTLSAMFRDPAFFKALRHKVIPYLKTYPFVRIWHAGCSTGEEVYSLAIILREEGLYDRTTIFATDYNEQALDKARHGVYDMEHMQAYTRNYQLAGGKKSFSQYYHARYDGVQLDTSLQHNIVFASHNLTTDSVFSEVHLVVCRNVLIYFNKPLQDRVLQLFHESLAYGGVLALGSKETMDFTQIGDQYKELSSEWKIYQKKFGHV